MCVGRSTSAVRPVLPSARAPLGAFGARSGAGTVCRPAGVGIPNGPRRALGHCLISRPPMLHHQLFQSGQTPRQEPNPFFVSLILTPPMPLRA